MDTHGKEAKHAGEGSLGGLPEGEHHVLLDEKLHDPAHPGTFRPYVPYEPHVMTLVVRESHVTLTNAPRGEGPGKTVKGVFKNTQYELHEGLFAGGSLIVLDGGRRVEYQVHGSGVPLVDAFRGEINK